MNFSITAILPVFLIGFASATTKKTVTFADTAEVLEFPGESDDPPLRGILKTPPSQRSRAEKSRQQARSRSASLGSLSRRTRHITDFDSSEEESSTDSAHGRTFQNIDEILNSTSSRKEREREEVKKLLETRNKPSKPVATTSSLSLANRSINSGTSSLPSTISGKKPVSTSIGESKGTLSRFKNKGPLANPILNTIIGVLDAFLIAYREGVKNEFISDDELDYYEARHGQVTAKRDPTEMALRIARPLGWLAANMWGFFDFPRSTHLWGLTFLLDIAVILGWRQYDNDWMISEMGHWDYALGLLLFTICGVISLVHQGLEFLSGIFFWMATALVFLAYAGVLVYAGFKKPHHYY